MGSRAAGATFALAVVGSLVLSRFPLTPSVLVTFDAANFAFALEDFNPSLHKPQPPGYPLFVGLTRLLHVFISDLPTLFTVAGIIATFAAVLALGRLAQDIAGWRAAIASAVLLIFHPAVWSSGLLNPVRGYLATASACIGLLVWRAWSPGSHRGWIIGAWAALGLFSGFRPTVMFLLAPLCLAASFRRRSSFLDFAYCAIALFVTVGLWVGACAWAVGGISAYIALLRDYSDQQFAETSLLFGASLTPALKMAGRALIWSFGPAACWAWMMFLARRQEVSAQFRRTGWFLLLWTVPSLLSATLFHSAEPGHVLTVVTPLCLAGGLVVAAMLRRWNGLGWTTASVAAPAACSIALFFYPPTSVMRVTSAEAVHLQENRVAPALALLDRYAKQERLAVIASPASTVPWRLLAYYQPNVPVIVLHDQSGYWVMRHGRLESQGRGQVVVPCSDVQLWFPEGESTIAKAGFESAGPLLLSRLDAGPSLHVSDKEFALNRPCPSLLAQE